jgi:hypothetical protein
MQPAAKAPFREEGGFALGSQRKTLRGLPFAVVVLLALTRLAIFLLISLAVALLIALALLALLILVALRGIVLVGLLSGLFCTHRIPFHYFNW